MKNLNLGEYLSGINDKLFVLNETANECAVEAMDILREIDDVYKGILDTGGAFEAIDKLMAVKNALAVQMAG